MGTLYIDHSIVTNEACWPDVGQAISGGKVRLVLSLWNLVEIGMAADAAQRERRINFLEGLNPIWAVERRAIQRQEVERFLWSHKYDVPPKELTALTPLLSVVDSFFQGARPRIGLTARQFIRETDFASLLPLKALSPAALRRLQGVDRRTKKSQEKTWFESWIAPSIPDCDPDGRLSTVAQKAELVAFCWRNRKLFFAACPCLAVEDALTTARTNDANRNPTDSDGPDLQHAAVAVAYCDIFYSRDGYQTQCAAMARKALAVPYLAEVCTTPAALSAALDSI